MQKISITQLSGYDVRDANDGGVTITATALTIQHVHTNTHTHRVELTHFLLCRSRLGEQHNDAYGLINCSTHTHAHTHTNTIQLWLTDMLLCVVRDTDTGTLTNTQHTVLVDRHVAVCVANVHHRAPEGHYHHHRVG